MIRKFFGTTIIAFVIMPTLFAQDSTKPFTISGSVDVYYRVGLSGNAKGSEALNNFTSFTNSNNTFQLGMASIKAQYTSGKVGAVIDLGFGKRAEEFAYADEGTLQSVKQAYLFYAPSDKVKFTFGKFGTHIGYELLDPQLNKNYSMSYMFTNGPFSHTGIKADFTLGGGMGLMIGVANPIDVTAPANGSDPKTLIAQVSSVGSKYSVYLNYAGYFGGKEYNPDASSLNQIGLTASATLSDKFSLGYDGTVQFVKQEDYLGPGKPKTTNWWGSALYANLTATDKLGLTLRAEYFGDKKYAIKTPGSDIFEATLSGNLKVGGFTFIPELRLDHAKDKVFGKFINTTTGFESQTAFSAILAAIYSF
ncbi:MAG: outer membrane beta-barrel protein [Ferruginibacter sp.]